MSSVEASISGQSKAASEDSKTKPSMDSRHAIDLRSDTVTRPTPEMRQAMASAEVGDDVYGEDPTVNLLEKRAAEIFAREAALFVPTGTMGNQIALKLHTHHGQEIICEERAHILHFEMAMLGWFSGCVPRAVRTEDGILTWEKIRQNIAARIYYRAQTGLISLENTHNMWGGAVMPAEVLEEICHEAHSLGLPVHLDGARIFNAAAVLGRPVAEITRPVDSVMFCLSKGLCAPAGSMLVGSREFVERARACRKALGGGMRQAGVLAAAGLIALEQMPARLPEDHANARFLAEELSRVPGIKLDPASVQTNIVIFETTGDAPLAAELSQALARQDVLANSVGARSLRLVAHRDVNRAACAAAVDAIKASLSRRQTMAGT